MLSLRLKQLREEKNLLQKDIANLLNISTSAYGFYEQGKREPNNETIKILADFYNVSTDYILGRNAVSSNKLISKSNIQSENNTSKNNSEFGLRLKNLREEKGITQQQLADFLKVGIPTIAGYEAKGKQPDFEKIIWLCNYFNVSSDYLLGLSDKRNNTLNNIGKDLNPENVKELRKFADLLKIKQSTEKGINTNENAK